MSQQVSLREMLDTLEHGQRDRSSRAMEITSIYRDEVGRLGKRQSRCLEVMGTMGPGETKHIVSMGEWSADNMLAWALGIVGPSELDFATWSLSVAPAARIIRMADDGHIQELRGVFDLRACIRKPEAMRMLRGRFGRGAIRIFDCHAKVYALTGGAFPMVMVSSANFTNNPRVEVSVISTDPEVVAFHREWMGAVWSGADPFEEALHV